MTRDNAYAIRAKRAYAPTLNAASTQPIPVIALRAATEVVSPAIRNANTLLITCAAMLASRPPVRHTSSPASKPKPSRSMNNGKFCVLWNRANTTAEAITPNQGLATRLPSACSRYPRKKTSSATAWSEEADQSGLRMVGEIVADSCGEQHNPVQHDGGNYQTPE
jgi:hypothetical protein